MSRQQPICKGVDSRGELIWGFIPMPHWQALMFPLRYVGDFAGFWYRKSKEIAFGIPAEDIQAPSMDLSKVKRYGKKSHRPPVWGD